MRRHTHAPRHGACHAQRATRTMGVWNPDKKHDGPAPEVDTPRQRQAAGAGPRWSRQCAVARISGFPAVGINLAGNWSYACAAMPCQLHTSAWNESTPDWGAAATQQEHIRPTATPSCGGTPAGAGEGISDNAVTAPPPPRCRATPLDWVRLWPAGRCHKGHAPSKRSRRAMRRTTPGPTAIELSACLEMTHAGAPSYCREAPSKSARATTPYNA